MLVLIVDDALQGLYRLLRCLSQPLTFLLEELLSLFLVGDEAIGIVAQHTSSQVGLQLGSCHHLAVLHSELIQLGNLPSHRIEFSQPVLQLVDLAILFHQPDINILTRTACW